ncbi:hypothetical protein LWI28_023786 [Acer negundo]|uniref:Uncharacterized protein n=1 Tax=Acer negundo TaxID=4023 RepID=A0AAD5JIT8_ACENE|nr:hypothetical protein LWI28_023786 [Acer negundo]KAK4860617.1 hypothetical protein QYF36_027361 [Acer negundo]
MSDFDFNNVKAQKVEAMRQYNRQKKLKSFLFLVEVFLGLALLFWYSTYYVPIAADVAGGFLRRSAVVFGSSKYVFVVINVLVVVIYVFSVQKPTKPDVYDEYVSITSTIVSGRFVSSSSASSAAAIESPPPEESVNTVSDRQIVCVDNAVHNPPADQSVVRATTATEAAAAYRYREPRQSRFDAVTTETKTYRRTQSERYGKGNQTRELRRSETVIKRETTSSSSSAVGRDPTRRSSSAAMDDLSNDDFRMTIETFIAAKKKSLIRENTLDLKLERKECVSTTLSRFN